MGLEPTTTSLENWDSTIELLPHIGASAGSRTPDTRLKRAVLYQLSYRSMVVPP